MTEINWLKLSGLMHQCMYNLENTDCPFNNFREMDNIQQYQALNNIGDKVATKMLSDCNSCRMSCKPILSNDLVITNPKQFRIVV